MPRRELRYPSQIHDWLTDWGRQLTAPASLILIGSGGLLWHAHQRGVTIPLPENSMDVDPITADDSVAALCYDAVIGSEFEQHHGWHVNLMPQAVLRELPAGWEDRASRQCYGHLTAVIPAPTDLLAPKLRRGEPRDLKHADWAGKVGLTT